MDLSDWISHGLILRAEGESLYRAAAASSRGSTLALFAYVFEKILFAGLPVIWAGGDWSEEGVVYDAGLTVVHATGEDPALRVLCFATGGETDDALVEALEERALQGCKDHLAAQPDVSKIYTCTLVGTRIRCWTLENKGDEQGQGEASLVGVWAGDCRGRLNHYLDIGLDGNRAVIEGALSHMLGDLRICTSPWY